MSTFARAKVSQFDGISRNKNIFRLDVTMEDTLSMYVFNRPQQLIHVDLHLPALEVLVPYQALIEILLHQLKDKC